MKLTVLGAGCWGLTLAWLLTDNFDEVCVWGRTCDLSEDLIKNKHCSKPLEVQLAQKVEITDDLKSAIKDADLIIVLDSGKLIGIGKHEQLEKTCNFYKKLCMLQDLEKEVN